MRHHLLIEFAHVSKRAKHRYSLTSGSPETRKAQRATQLQIMGWFLAQDTKPAQTSESSRPCSHHSDVKESPGTYPGLPRGCWAGDDRNNKSAGKTTAALQHPRFLLFTSLGGTKAERPPWSQATPSKATSSSHHCSQRPSSFLRRLFSPKNTSSHITALQSFQKA